MFGLSKLKIKLIFFKGVVWMLKVVFIVSYNKIFLFKPMKMLVLL